jgi:hypothetical protein
VDLEVEVRQRDERPVTLRQVHSLDHHGHCASSGGRQNAECRIRKFAPRLLLSSF